MASSVLFKNMDLLDPRWDAPRGGYEVLVEGATIKEVSNKSIKASKADVVDCGKRVLMPGLIDAHTHLTYHFERPDVWVLEQKESVELNTFFAARNATWVLAAGFTSIGDGGCPRTNTA